MARRQVSYRKYRRANTYRAKRGVLRRSRKIVPSRSNYRAHVPKMARKGNVNSHAIHRGVGHHGGNRRRDSRGRFA